MKKIQCPHCQSDWWGFEADENQEVKSDENNNAIASCGNCGKEFKVKFFKKTFKVIGD